MVIEIVVKFQATIPEQRLDHQCGVCNVSPIVL